jgi:hypothetical protein
MDGKKAVGLYLGFSSYSIHDGDKKFGAAFKQTFHDAVTTAHCCRRELCRNPG